MFYTKEYTESDFTYKKYTFTANGQWDYSYGDKFNINASSILTKLIQEAGRWCESYASDLFISWSIIEETLKTRGNRTEKYLFGFRKSGVDHKEWVIHRYNNQEKYEYRAIWVLDITVDDDEMTMTLGRYDS